ncbi:MAG TPA: polysaccharide biosynthesis/export family protein [Hyphomicrobiales bacterium]|nr:polysaccharide biosynthesis/export family protein [Hyphomicrobiales bacterium]
MVSLLPFVFVAAMTLGVSACAPPPAPVAFAGEPGPYVLGPGDKVRLTVYGQTNLTGVYPVDAGGKVTVPLIGAVPAAGETTSALRAAIATRLRGGYLRDPDVTVDVDTYRPFFVLGEVTTAGQYPYEAGMTAEKAVAVAGGFSPRARHDSVIIARKVDGRIVRVTAPVTALIEPGDVITARERWF